MFTLLYPVEEGTEYVRKIKAALGMIIKRQPISLGHLYSLQRTIHPTIVSKHGTSTQSGVISTTLRRCLKRKRIHKKGRNGTSPKDWKVPPPNLRNPDLDFDTVLASFQFKAKEKVAVCLIYRRFCAWHPYRRMHPRPSIVCTEWALSICRQGLRQWLVK